MRGSLGALAATLASAAALAPLAAAAQAYQCRAPAAPASVPRVERDGPVRQMPIAGYTLALSWSPEYCRGRERNTRDRFQCSGQGGRFGFIVHGLWPEGRSGTWPQWCPAAHPLTPGRIPWKFIELPRMTADTVQLALAC